VTGESKIRKKSVDLAAPAVRGSRIRRDPPKPVKEKTIDPEERDRWIVVVGVLTFTVALCVLAVAFSSYSGWSPRQYSLNISASE